MTRDAFAKAWDRYAFVPLIVLSLAFLALYAVPIVNPDLSSDTLQGFEMAQNVIWAVFIVDVVGRFVIADKKLVFLRRNIIEIIAIALPMIRPLRALRLLTVLTIGLRRVGGVVRTKSLCTSWGPP